MMYMYIDCTIRYCVAYMNSVCVVLAVRLCVCVCVVLAYMCVWC